MPQGTTVELRTVKGKPVEVWVNKDNPTVGQVIDALCRDHNYGSNTQLMFGGKLLKSTQHVEEFPYASVIIVGENRGRASPGVSPQRRTLSPQVQMDGAHVSASAGSSGNSSVDPPPKANTGAGESPRTANAMIHRNITIRVSVPQSRRELEVHVPDTGTPADLYLLIVAKDASLGGCKLIFKGQLLDLTAQEQLRHKGFFDGAVIHAVAGNDVNPDAVTLWQAAEDMRKLERGASVVGGVTDSQRKSLYEESMKLLFKLDALQELPTDLKQQRKTLVHQIQALQDKLGIKHE